MERIDIKPLSLNSAYRGRRFSTPELKEYKRYISSCLPDKSLPDGKMAVWYRFGVSARASDGDNLIKCFQDALGDHYEFNDNRIYKWVVEKVIVKKGQEFIEWNIEEYEE